MERKPTKNYIIQAHKNPKQLKRLIDKLNDDSSSFYIHIDLKSDIIPFKNIINYSNVFFIKERVNCIWADYSQVVATLNLIKNVLNNAKDGHIIFLSGQDYPIKSLNHIDRFLLENKEYDFIEFDSFTEPVSLNQEEFYERIRKYKINLSDKRGDFTIISPLSESNYLEIISYLKLILKRKIKLTDLLYKYKNSRNSNILKEHFRGSNWWCLTYNTTKNIYEYYTNNKIEIDNYYKDTYCADEQFFHTILKNVIGTNKNSNVKGYLHYVDFSRKNVPVPVLFTKNDIDVLLNQPEGKLFARKFDYDIDLAVFDLIDKNIIQR